MIKNRSTTMVPGGYIYFQPETNWSAPNPWLGFDAVVSAIIAMRLANKKKNLPTDRPTVENDLEAYTEKRLRDQYGAKADQWLVGEQLPPPENFYLPLQPPQWEAKAVAASVKRVTSGVKVILDWLGHGLKPVDAAIAAERAHICADCPKNVEMEGIAKAAGTVGDLLHSIMQARSQMDLTTPDDDKLKQCSACFCHLPAKVWVPGEHVKLTDEFKSQLDPRCWQLRL